MMHDPSRDLMNTETVLDAHARLLLLGDHLEAARVAAALPAATRRLMAIASSLDEVIQPLAMAPAIRGRLRQELLTTAYRGLAATGHPPLAPDHGAVAGRRSLVVLPRSSALRLIGAGTAVAAALGVAMLVRRRHGVRQPDRAAIGLG